VPGIGRPGRAARIRRSEPSLDVFAAERGWWGYHWAPPNPLSITRIIASGSMDAELAALLWLLLEARVPIVVAAEAPLAGKSTTLTALLDFLPRGIRRLFLRGWAEDFSWLPQASDLGWSGSGNGLSAAELPPRWRHMGTLAASPEPIEPADPSTTYLLASELSSHLPVYTWGIHARVCVRALQLGYGLGTSLHADSLEEVFEQLTSPPVSLVADEVRRLGVVLVLRLIGPDGAPVHFPEGTMEAEFGPLQPQVRRRVVAAHYLRPLERDAAGHLQRRPPAVLATWDPASDCFEHYGWGITAELADRVGRDQAWFESEHRARTDHLSGLVRTGVTGLTAVRRAIDDYRDRQDGMGRPA
jgi:hypothetical protein